MVVVVFIVGLIMVLIVQSLFHLLVEVLAQLWTWLVALLGTIALCWIYKSEYLGFWEWFGLSLLIGLIAGIITLPVLPFINGGNTTIIDNEIKGSSESTESPTSGGANETIT